MWTKNYENIINTRAFCANQGYGSTSPHPFDETYRFNCKSHTGKIYEIQTYNSYGSSAGLYHTYGAFVTRDTEDVFSSYVVVRTSFPDTVSNSRNLHIAFGSSNTEESRLDYNLGALVSDFTTNATKATVTANTDGSLTINYQILITATADITIQEIGLFLDAKYNRSSTNASTAYSFFALINRIVLDEPVSVASGEVANITFSVTTPIISFT